jgi:hypothetical protein
VPSGPLEGVYPEKKPQGPSTTLRSLMNKSAFVTSAVAESGRVRFDYHTLRKERTKGLRPSFSAQVRLGEPGAPVWIREVRDRLEG